MGKEVVARDIDSIGECWRVELEGSQAGGEGGGIREKISIVWVPRVEESKRGDVGARIDNVDQT